MNFDPRWFAVDGKRVGITFECPHCRVQRLGVYWHHAGREAEEDGYIRAHHPDGPEHIWSLLGPEDFSQLTLSPSIDASKSGHWHGSIVGGICQP